MPYRWPDVLACPIDGLMAEMNSPQANFTNYLPGKPSGASQGLDCIEMFAGGLELQGGWLDQNCSKQRHYICQKPAGEKPSFISRSQHIFFFKMRLTNKGCRLLTKTITLLKALVS